MSKKYKNKADHNQQFLDSIDSDYPEDYFDWKVTVQFYICLHKCYCVLEAKDYLIESSHHDNIKNLKEVDINLAKSLRKLFTFSKQSRYDGFLTDDAMLRVNKYNFLEGKSHANIIEKGAKKFYPVLASSK